MSFLSDIVTGRRFVLLCARLFVQCMLAWSTTELGVDDATLFGGPHRASDAPVTRHKEMTAPEFNNGLAAFRPVPQHRSPC